MTTTVLADQTRAQVLQLTETPRVIGLVPCIGGGHCAGASSHSWTTANAVIAKARKAFGAYGIRRSEELST